MIRTLRKLTATATLLLCMSATLATPITFEPTDSTVELGDQVSVAVMIAPIGELIGTFDIAVNWDPAILTLAAVTFGTSLGDPDPFAFETLTGVVGGGGTALISEVSLLLDLTGLQDGSAFDLFTLIFDTTAIGTSALTFGDLIIGDAFGLPLVNAPQPGSGVINVIERIAIPVPGTFALFGLGLALLCATRTRALREAHRATKREA